MNCDGEECPICYEPLSDNEISIECPQCEKKFNLTCILQSCKTFWNRNEKCKCPLCRSDLRDDDYLRLINDINEEIEKNEKKLSDLRYDYNDEINKIIQQMYALGEFDISKIEGDPAKLEEINGLKNENKILNHKLYLITYKPPDWENEFGGSRSRRYKKKTTRRNRRNRKTAKGKKNKRHSRKHNRK